MLLTKPIKSLRGPDDGLRVSIMSRHTLDDGVTPDRDITPYLFDEWWVQLAPPARLIGDFKKRGLSWEEFEIRYLIYLRTELTRQYVLDLMGRSKNKNITLLCKEFSPERCHRRLLAEECLRLDPKLKVVIT